MGSAQRWQDSFWFSISGFSKPEVRQTLFANCLVHSTGPWVNIHCKTSPLDPIGSREAVVA